MDVKQYLTLLLNMYLKISVCSWVKVEKYLDENYPKVTFTHNDFFLLSNYNLAFQVKSFCFISKKLAQKNIKKLETILYNEDIENCLFTILLKKNKCYIYIYDIYGNIVKKDKIKFVSINWF